MKPRHWFCLAAGGCDTLTGLLLVVAPLFTLRLMMIPGHEADPVLVRFIGAFVFGIGSSYLRPFLTRDPAAREARFAGMLDFTAGARVAVGSFVTVAVLAGALHPMWATVAVTDLGLAAVQIVMLRRGVFARGG